MLKYSYMRIRKTRIDLSILILGLIISTLLFGIICKKQSLFASATSTDSSTTSDSTDSSEHYITFYDNGTVLTVRSDAQTVREAIARADIKLGDYDTVEPALDDEINEEDFNINIYRAREVVVIDGYTRKYLKTAKTDAAEVVAAAGIELLDADIVTVVVNNNILESGTLTAYQLVRAKVINLNFNGKNMQVRTQAKTVGAFLKEQGISADQADNWISAATDTPITDGITLAVYHQGKQTLTIEEDIAFSETYTYDYALDYGTRAVTQAGKLGKKVATYEVEMQDGVELSRVLVSEIITQNPETQQVTIGMKVNLPPGTHQDWMAAAGIAASDYGYVNYIVDKESHWNPLSKNTSSGATGLCQALPGSKMASAGSDWETNPITQLRWCNSYAVGRYGGWAEAFIFWENNHWW